MEGRASAYKTEYITREWVLSYKGTELIEMMLDASFKYNGTYVYTNDGQYIVKKYNGSKFNISKVNTTTSANKSKVQAKYVVKGTVTNSKYGGNKDVVFKLFCTPTGATSSTAS